MKKTVYYRLHFTLESPLSIGSGAGESTDKDMIVDKYGTPFIPGTSLAGVLRSSMKDKKEQEHLFGSVRINTKADGAASDSGDDSRESAVKVYDALLDTQSDNGSEEYGRFYITERDSVALKDKVSAEGAKFDFQAVETGAKFIGYLELTVPGTEENTPEEQKIENALAQLNSGDLRLGAKTTRGCGEVSVEVKKKTFAFTRDENDQRDAWLLFDMFDESVWKDVAPLAISAETQNIHIVMELKNKAGVSIREYSTDISTEDENKPDYLQLSLHNADKTPVIPGSSWAGAFRERFGQFTCKDAVEDLFGYVTQGKPSGDKKPARKSRITLSESQLFGGQWKNLTRNSIDRFSSATKDGNLYTEQTYYGGATRLEIIADRKTLAKYITPFSCVLKDLHNGYLAVGGLTAVGRGLFAIVKMTVDGADVTDRITSPDGVLTEQDIVCEKGGEENHAE